MLVPAQRSALDCGIARWSQLSSGPRAMGISGPTTAHGLSSTTFFVFFALQLS